MDSSTSSQTNQPYSPLNRVTLDMNFEQLINNQEYYQRQDYSMGQGSAHGSASVDDDDDYSRGIEWEHHKKLQDAQRHYICCLLMVKKPGGIIALLDEAWFNLRSLEPCIAETSLTVDGVGLFSFAMC
ncbi:hypothetical protein Tco_1268447 [Tanacetum coccineum]